MRSAMRIGFQLLGLLLLLVEEFLVIGDAAYGRLGLGRDLDQVEFHAVGELQRFAYG